MVYKKAAKRANCFELKKGSFSLDKLFREAMNAPSLEAFKVRLDEALSDLTLWKLSLLMTGDGLDDL